MQETLSQLKQLATNEDIAAMWLYGSRARQQYSENSDYDIAVLFSSYLADPLERRLRPEELSIEWSAKLNCEINIVDVTLAPLPLAQTILKDDVLLMESSAEKRMKFEQSHMSKWELDYLYSRKIYA